MARRTTGDGGGYFDRVATPASGQTLILAPHAPRFAPVGDPLSTPPRMATTEPAVLTSRPSVTVASSPPALNAPSAPIANAAAPMTATPPAGPPPLVNVDVLRESPVPLPLPRAAPAFAELERLAARMEPAPSVQSAVPAPNAVAEDVPTERAALTPPMLAPRPAKMRSRSVKPNNLKPVAQPADVPVTVARAGPPAVDPTAPATSPLPSPAPPAPAVPAPAGPSIHIGLVEVRVAAPASAPVAPVFAPRAPAPAAAPRTALARGYGWRYGFGQS